MPHKLPTVLSQEEVVRLIDSAPKRLYRILLVLCATRARRADAPRIKVQDIDRERMLMRKPVTIHSCEALKQPLRRSLVGVDRRSESLKVFTISQKLHAKEG